MKEPRRLRIEDVPLIKGMLHRGDLQSDIAAYFGINGGRVAEVMIGNRYPEIAPAPASALPPAGPYLATRSKVAVHAVLMRLRGEIDAALADIEQWEAQK